MNVLKRTSSSSRSRRGLSRPLVPVERRHALGQRCDREQEAHHRARVADVDRRWRRTSGTTRHSSPTFSTPDSGWDGFFLQDILLGGRLWNRWVALAAVAVQLHMIAEESS